MNHDSPANAERELTERVSLTGPDGRLNRAAVGFARRPLVDTAGIGRGSRWTGRHGLLRNKRWEYWNVITPTHIAALTVSSIDYAAVHEVWVFDRRTGEEVGKAATVIPPRGVELPPSLGDGPARARAKGLTIDITPMRDGGTRLRAVIADAEIDVTVRRAAGHDCLAVVVPWSDTRFQYTVKDVALPASGTLTVGGVMHVLPEGQSWAVLDHGRGRWPYDITWNWAAGAGRTHGRTIGLQFGGKWTEGTGSTENGVVIDGRLHKIGSELRWDYATDDFLAPWRISGGGLQAELTPFHDKRTRTNFGVLSGATDQCFGIWSGTFDTGDEVVEFNGLVGFAEHVHNRW
ncbi:DUF2804 domain-containing protein [Gordonia sp. (in: high G+C Gram-positive bacteria)]|uniref:DUF2804 domain-containing protein n=1 Tax=Gordonia sp. (in: high G+C Gram-positive bacteria) TaxID=84139 RepID=UPI0016BBBF2D|nr:DUF2804 domain-containing protein [Gordonia sp. (in: high G+C Gram-positive bacteria)]NLG47848.1 DUF2804 domain-containing protein [Gordonia sp. (in: high G+C Gram-positive bacteria)]